MMKPDHGPRTTDHRWKRKQYQRGFTLIEILVVVIIISILASLTVIGVTIAITSSKRANTESLIGQLRGTLEQYKTRWGDYPPSSLDRIRGVRVPNDTNNGIEAMVACLGSKKKGGKLLNLPTEDLCGNG